MGTDDTHLACERGRALPRSSSPDHLERAQDGGEHSLSWDRKQGLDAQHLLTRHGSVWFLSAPWPAPASVREDSEARLGEGGHGPRSVEGLWLSPLGLLHPCSKLLPGASGQEQGLPMNKNLSWPERPHSMCPTDCDQESPMLLDFHGHPGPALQASK